LHSTVNAPGGQLVQGTDTFAATRNARIVLIDDHGVRATMTASWLIQMGWPEVYVVENALESGPLYKGEPPAEVLGLAQIRPDFITPHELEQAIAAGHAAVVDFDTSLRYRDAHIPGAWLAIRANLAANLERVPPAKLLVLTSADGILAQLAAPEAAQCTNVPVKVLQGGTAAWRRRRSAAGEWLDAACRPDGRRVVPPLRPHGERRGSDERLSDVGGESRKADRARRRRGVPHFHARGA
jgi:rhodanese-related sulfurtransferase